MRRRIMFFDERRGLATGICAGIVAIVSLASCTSKQPTAPGSTPPAASPNIAVASMSVASETFSSGAHAYRVTVKMRETGGAQATVSSIDLTFMNGSTPVVTSHSDRPISDTSNVCPANATLDSRELTTMDDNPSHPLATSVSAKVTFTDGAAMTSSATASADVPASSPPPPATYTLSGSVSDDVASRAVAGGTIQIMGGTNAGKTASTDGSGNYTLTGIAAGTFVVRATANGYDSLDKTTSVAQDARLDFRLRPTSSGPPPPPAPCAYTVNPGSSSTNFQGGTFTASVSNTSGSCGWQATSDVSWITFPDGASGTGSATLSYLVVANLGLSDTTARAGTITVTWSGGSAQLRVQQGGASQRCEFTVSAGPELGNVPSAGGQFTVTLTAVNTGAPPGKCSLTVSADPWIALPATSAPMTTPYTFTVSANPTPGTTRSGTVTFRSPDTSASVGVTQR